MTVVTAGLSESRSGILVRLASNWLVQSPRRTQQAEYQELAIVGKTSPQPDIAPLKVLKGIDPATGNLFGKSHRFTAVLGPKVNHEQE